MQAGKRRVVLRAGDEVISRLFLCSKRFAHAMGNILKKGIFLQFREA
jgi:hypothetical protein